MARGRRTRVESPCLLHLPGLDLRGQVAVYRITVAVEPKTNLFQVVGHSPLLVPEGCRTAAAETIARANHGLRLGKFELDFDDGEVRFQVSQILVDDAVGRRDSAVVLSIV